MTTQIHFDTQRDLGARAGVKRTHMHGPLDESPPATHLYAAHPAV